MNKRGQGTGGDRRLHPGAGRPLRRGPPRPLSEPLRARRVADRASRSPKPRPSAPKLRPTASTAFETPSFLPQTVTTEAVTASPSPFNTTQNLVLALPTRLKRRTGSESSEKEIRSAGRRHKRPRNSLGARSGRDREASPAFCSLSGRPRAPKPPRRRETETPRLGEAPGFRVRAKLTGRSGRCLLLQQLPKVGPRRVTQTSLLPTRKT